MTAPDSPRHEALRAPLSAWVAERHQRMLEEVMAAWQEAMHRFHPDQALLERLASALPASGGLPATDDRDLGLALDALEGASSQAEVLKRLLEGLEPLVERSAIFVMKQGIAALYAWNGFDGDRPKAGTTVVPPPDLEELLSGRVSALGRGPATKALLHVLTPMEGADARILPLRTRRKPVALLLLDSGLRQTLDQPHTLRALALAASACLSLHSGKEEEKAAPEPVPAHPTAPTMLVPEPISEPAAPDLDPKLKAAAERFARVLASDIELYFPAKVAQARTGGNLYGLLGDELNRSRHSFQERFGEELEARQSIFRKAVIDQLCEGDPAKLGPAPW
jgi:hypothetical protein